MLYTKHATASIDDVQKRIEAAAAEQKFGVLGVHDLKQKMADKGIAFERPCRVIEVCNPAQAKKVLDAEMTISTMLPCRIALWQDGDDVTVSMMKPTALLEPFGRSDLDPVAREVETSMVKMIDQATR